jgi:hypothetical protein
MSARRSRGAREMAPPSLGSGTARALCASRPVKSRQLLADIRPRLGGATWCLAGFDWAAVDPRLPRRTTAGPQQPTSPLVTACKQGLVKKLSHTPGSCPNPPACSNEGYCTIGFDCCTRDTACVNGGLTETTVCNPSEGSGGACGG